VAVSNATASPGFLMSGAARLSEVETTLEQRGGRQASSRPCVRGAKQAAAHISPKHVRLMTNVVTDAVTGIPPSAQERRT